MRMNNIGGVTLPPVGHIGIVVRDIEKTVDYYSSVFGIGPFSILEYDIQGAILRGTPCNGRIKVAAAQQGPLALELVEPLGEEGFYSEFLRQKGEGLHHLGFHVDDIAGVLAELAKQGTEPVFHSSSGPIPFAYLDTEKIGGAILELIQMGDQKGDA